MSEALIFASTNPQYDDRLFIELQVQYMKTPSLNLVRTCCVHKLFLTFRTIFVHMFSPFCKEKSFWQRFTCTYFFLEWTYYFPWLLEAPNSKRNYLSEEIIFQTTLIYRPVETRQSWTAGVLQFWGQILFSPKIHVLFAKLRPFYAEGFDFMKLISFEWLTDFVMKFKFELLFKKITDW